MNVQNWIRFGSLVAMGSLAVAASAAGGCGGSSTTSAATGGSGGGGGTADAGSDGKQGTGGTGGTGGSKADAGKDLPGNYTITACPGVTAMTPAGLDQTPTCNTVCGKAHCVPASTPGAGSSQIPSCDDGMGGMGKCIPDDVSSVNGAFVLKTCTSSLGMGPGRCVPYCFLGQYKDQLPADDCTGDGTRCAPCINPLTNMPSGACDDYCGATDAGTDVTTTDATTTDATTTDATTTDAAATDGAAATDSAATGDAPTE